MRKIECVPLAACFGEGGVWNVGSWQGGWLMMEVWRFVGWFGGVRRFALERDGWVERVG